jgi:hypothetical protein
MSHMPFAILSIVSPFDRRKTVVGSAGRDPLRRINHIGHVPQVHHSNQDGARTPELLAEPETGEPRGAGNLAESEALITGTAVESAP